MKSIHIITVTLALFFGIHSTQAEGIHVNPRLQKVEVPLDAVLAPYHGYDNTNNIEVVLHGNLPNTCYQLDEYTLEKDPVTHTIRIHQFATKKLDGVCGEENALPEHFTMLVPFTNVASLGILPAGDYTIKYDDDTYHSGQKSLNVKVAHKTTVDDYPYASVSGISTSDVVQKNDKLSATLSGVLTSSCSYLDTDNIKIEKQKDVYVVLPILKMKLGVMCIQTLIPFMHTIELEAPKEQGNYLIQVRSMNGKSVNRVVSAIE